MLGGLVVANAGLRSEVQKLEGGIRAYNQAAERAVLPQMVEELVRMRIVNGHVDVAGPGVEVRVGAGVSAVDLQDMVNEVRNVGAEAISLNGLRLGITSTVSQDQHGIILDGVRIEAPYVFQAIGDPATMETALRRPGSQLGILQVTYPGLRVEVKSVPLMVLVARPQRARLTLAQPVR
jgi:uncharacterized protein YlxW (UPF0749 family)